MRMPLKFSRFVGAGGTVLGVAPDLAPNTAGTGSVPASPEGRDNVLRSKFANSSGWPFQRVAIGYRGPAMAPDLPGVGLWLFNQEGDEGRGWWYRLPTLLTLKANQLAISDSVVLMENAPFDAAALTQPTAGSFLAWLAVPDPGGSPAGEYVFTMGPDQSNSP